MTNSDEKNSQKPEIKKVVSKESKKENSNIPKPKSWMSKGAVFIALAAFTLALYALWQNQQLQGKIEKNTPLLVTQVNNLTHAQDKIEKQIEEKTTHIQENHALLQGQFEDLNKQIQTAMQQRFYQNQNWLLLKARYCLELAEINAHWGNSFDATIALLQQANQLLQQLNSPKIFEIRQAIATDIAQLQATPLVDIAGILSQLDAAQHSVDKLNLSETLSNKSAESQAAPTKALSVWGLRFQDSMDLLSKLVIIRHHNEPVQPIISPAVETLLKENIRLNLQEAQWAVLNNNPQVYSLVLNQAITILKKNFNEQAQNTAVLIKMLDQLEHIELIQKKPATSLALPLLNELIEKQPSTDTQGEN